MDLIDIVKSYLSNYVSLNEQEFNFLSGLFELRNFAKREKLVEEGEVEKYLNFILQGLARKFFKEKSANLHELKQFTKREWGLSGYRNPNEFQTKTISVGDA